jgi:hypothetical protein
MVQVCALHLLLATLYALSVHPKTIFASKNWWQWLRMKRGKECVQKIKKIPKFILIKKIAKKKIAPKIKISK